MAVYRDSPTTEAEREIAEAREALEKAEREFGIARQALGCLTNDLAVKRDALWTAWGRLRALLAKQKEG